jgi:large subunit ribosomal protein L11
MAKKLDKQIKLQIPAGKATPAPPIGTVLGPAGINIGEFVNQFNEQTRELGGDIIPVLLNVYDDRSFDFIMKKSPASRLILKKIAKDKGSGKPHISKVGKLSKKQLEEIAEEKMEDLNANDIDAAKKIIAGTARSMGVEVEGA